MYKKVALKYHPDKALNTASCSAHVLLHGVSPPLATDSDWQGRTRKEAEWLFKLVAEAHDVLCDPQKRALLDCELRSDARFGTQTGNGCKPSGRGHPSRHWSRTGYSTSNQKRNASHDYDRGWSDEETYWDGW